MSFLDPKERVIDLQLTSYGKHLLAAGRFKPVEYAFFDSDIIYDQRFVEAGPARVEELQNNIENRIQEETPRLTTQTIYRPADIGVFTTNDNLISDLMPGTLTKVWSEEDHKWNTVTQTPDKSYIFQEPIGNSAYNSNNIAAWDIGFYKARLISVTGSWAGKNDEMPTVFTPQLSSSLQYSIETYEPSPNTQNSNGNSGYDVEEESIYDTNIPIVFDNGSSMVYKDDFVLLKIEEANTEFLKENFELEVFEIQEDASEKKDKDGNVIEGPDGNPIYIYSEVLIPLYFQGDDLNETSRVDYWFNVDIDFEISEEEYCNLTKGSQDKIKNIYTDKVFNCESREATLRSLNIYGTKENQDPGDICE